MCPATDQTPGVTAEAEISYTPDSYEGLGQLTVKSKDGHDGQRQLRAERQEGRATAPSLENAIIRRG